MVLPLARSPTLPPCIGYPGCGPTQILVEINPILVEPRTIRELKSQYQIVATLVASEVVQMKLFPILINIFLGSFHLVRMWWVENRSRFVIIWSGQMLVDFLEFKTRKDNWIIQFVFLCVEYIPNYHTTADFAVIFYLSLPYILQTINLRPPN